MVRGLSAVVLALAVALDSACGGYAGGFTHFLRPFDGERSRVGCLDVAVSAPDIEVDGVVLEYYFGNRCDSAVWVDFPSITVAGRDGAGATIPLAPFDPKREIRVALLDGRAVGAELIEYRGPESFRLQQICVDLRSIDNQPRDEPVLVCADTPPRPKTDVDELIAPYADGPTSGGEHLTTELMP